MTHKKSTSYTKICCSYLKPFFSSNISNFVTKQVKIYFNYPLDRSEVLLFHLFIC